MSFYLRQDAPDQVVIIEEKVTAPTGETSIRKYSKGKLLGKGGFAKCYELTNLDTQKVLAAKVIEKSSLNKNRAKQKVLETDSTLLNLIAPLGNQNPQESSP